MLPADFGHVDRDLVSDHNVWFVQNSDKDPVTSCFNHDFIGFSPSLL